MNWLFEKDWIIEQGKIRNIACIGLVCLYAFGGGVLIAVGL